MREIVSVLFDGFETLDLFGPVEIFGRLKNDFRLNLCSENGGIITSSQNVRIITEPFPVSARDSILFIPGGDGIVKLIKDKEYIKTISRLAKESEYVLTVCTGSILLASTGLLDGKKATSNKRLFMWALNESDSAKWIKKARWVKDGKFYTSSGISAGMDMTLGFISDIIGYDIAKKQSTEIEYIWNEDPSYDIFAGVYGLSD